MATSFTSAHDNFRPAALAAFQRAYPLRLSSDNPLGRCMVERREVHITDLEQDTDFSEAARERGKAIGYRALIAVPMLLDGSSIGAIAVGREAPGPFTDKQITLLNTFADQAVIAIENVRLFKELDKKNAALTETLEQQTATAEILRVISSSPTDVQPVFDAIVASAQALSGAAGTSAVFLVRDDVVTVAAADGVSPAWRAQYPRAFTPDTVVGRAIIERRTVHAEDLETDPAYETAPGRLIDAARFSEFPC